MITKGDVVFELVRGGEYPDKFTLIKSVAPIICERKVATYEYVGPDMEHRVFSGYHYYTETKEGYDVISTDIESAQKLLLKVKEEITSMQKGETILTARLAELEEKCHIQREIHDKNRSFWSKLRGSDD